MEWVYVFLTVINNVPILDAADGNYKTQEACLDANAGLNDDPFWCVPRNWLDEDQRQPVRAFAEP